MSFEVTDKRTIDRRPWDEATSAQVVEDLRAATRDHLERLDEKPVTKKTDYKIEIRSETLARCQAQVIANQTRALIEAGRQGADQKS